MPNYHFITQDGERLLDPVGTVLSDVDVARREAARLLGHLLIEDPAELVRTQSLQVIVTDDAGSVLFGWSVSRLGMSGVEGGL
jgi:hypothetical protein